MASRMKRKRYIEKAREMDCGEVDDDAGVSRNTQKDGDHGAYVSVWVWVPDDE